jgi:hypothetical protein
VAIAQARGTLVRTAQRRILRSYTSALYTKTRRQTIQHGRRNAQFVGESRRGLGRHTSSSQSNSRKESKPRSRSRNLGWEKSTRIGRMAVAWK